LRGGASARSAAKVASLLGYAEIFASMLAGPQPGEASRE
jgi:hypothetical protein